MTIKLFFYKNRSFLQNELAEIYGSLLVLRAVLFSYVYVTKYKRMCLKNRQ